MRWKNYFEKNLAFKANYRLDISTNKSSLGPRASLYIQSFGFEGSQYQRNPLHINAYMAREKKSEIMFYLEER